MLMYDTANRERSFESPHGVKGKGPVMSYEKFVQLLDTEDAVAQKAIDIIVKDVFTRARGRKQAIDEARQLRDATTYSSVAAAAAARRGEAGEEARRAWHADVPSLSQRLHGWRYLNAGDADRPQGEAAHYDAIIADAQRQVASPLPMVPGIRQQQQQLTDDGPEDYPEPLFDSADWPDLNSAARPHDLAFDSWGSETESENEDDQRVADVERALASTQSQRDTARNNLARLSTVSSASNNASTRRRILERLEQRRRDLMDRVEGQRSTGNRAYPSYFSTSFQRTVNGEASDNGETTVEREPMVPVQYPSTPMPIILGGDFSELPANVSHSDSDTYRANYGPLQRSNSIRRSGFHNTRHAYPGSLPAPVASSSIAGTGLTTTHLNPLATSFQPRLPLSLSNPTIEHSDETSTGYRRQLDTLFGRDTAEAPSADAGPDQAQRASSFEDFSRATRNVRRASREREMEDFPSRTAQTANNDMVNQPHFRFHLSPTPEATMASSPVDADAMTELLGSSSSVAGLGTLTYSASSTSRVSAITEDGRRNIIPPRAPILSRRSFPLESQSNTVERQTGSRPASTNVIASAEASNGRPSSAEPAPSARASSVPERGPVYRRAEILSLAQVLSDDDYRSPRSGL
jgi:hypothetical protein